MPCEPTTTAAASRYGKVDDRLGHVDLVRDRVGLGIEPERTGEPGTVSGDDRGVMLPRLLNFGHELRIKRDLDDPGCVQTGVERRHRGQSGLPHRDNKRDAAGEELGSTAHRGVGEIRAVVGNQHTRLRHRHGP
jgi:hypothetical protein